ncbi:membrane protein of unknown function [Mesotoga infera]|uniref:EpsG family protein n=1 Tax=Mesotoga infera TaxID=1236046 RepID=A0A7Z7LEY8_9BACT|nr:EpsG family protein [Mesotoga infera]SSC12130.1 membrane protein of unknown function [Mesotoga infera]
MAVYYVLIASLTFFTIFDLVSSRLSKKYLVILVLIAFVLIQAFRSVEVGIDTRSYIKIFTIAKFGNLSTLSAITNFESGFLLFIKIISLFTENTQVFLGVLSVCILATIIYIIYKYSKMPMLSLFLFFAMGFYGFTFSGIRQSLAIALCFASYGFIRSRRPVLFVLLMILAASIHYSALVFLIAYPLSRLGIKKRHFLLVITVFLIIFLGRGFVFSVIQMTITRRYTSAIYYEASDSYSLLLVMLLLFMFTMFIGRSSTENLESNTLRNFLLIAVFIQLFASLSPVAMRAGYYFWWFSVLLIPEVIVNQPTRRERHILLVVILIFGFMYFQFLYSSGMLNTSPYKAFW